METKFKIIETPDYILVVSDEDASNSYIYFTGTPTGIYKTGIKYKNYNNDEFYEDAITGMSDTYFAKISKKIIAHQPKGNAPELDLPLLSEIYKKMKLILPNTLNKLNKNNMNPTHKITIESAHEGNKITIEVPWDSNLEEWYDTFMVILKWLTFSNPEETIKLEE